MVPGLAGYGVPDQLRCESRQNPLGVDAPTPRLSWQLEGAARGLRQTAYRLLIASSPDALASNCGDVWDSGKVMSDQSVLIPYGGSVLLPERRYYWKVTVWDQDAKSSTSSEPAWWETGSSDWRPAHWIESPVDDRNSPLSQRPYVAEGSKPGTMVESFPSPLFRRAFPVNKAVARARVYLSSLGAGELYLNGQKVGEDVLSPAQTTYDQRAFYVVHDITSAIKQGDNVVGLWLGNGFFGQTCAFRIPPGQNTPYGIPHLGWGKPVAIARILLKYQDGSSQTIVTDQSWKTTTSPVMFDNVYGGESYDARREQPGWAAPGFDYSKWSAATEIAAPTMRLVAESIPPIRRIRNVEPKRLAVSDHGGAIYDFGENISALPKLKVRQPAGTQIQLRVAETLMPGGKEIDQRSLGAFATGLPVTLNYICKGGGEEIWQPRFCFAGFRYVEISGLHGQPGKDMLSADQVRTAVESAGSFSCSNNLFNRIYQTSIRTVENNLHGIPEDCPDREKCAWDGDAHATAEFDIFAFDMARFWSNFEDDMQTTLGTGHPEAGSDGAAPGIPFNIAVGRRLAGQAKPDWGVASVLIPWDVYQYYGDIDVLRRNYELMKRWVDYTAAHASNHIVMQGYGDWCPPGGLSPIECPVSLSSTAYQYGALRIMQQVAQVLGKPADANAFSAEADATREAFQNKFLHGADGYGTQTGNAIALRFHLPTEQQEPMVAGALVKTIKTRRDHAFTGIHGSGPLYLALDEFGYDQLAYDMMNSTTYPSYGFMLQQGNTTWPEDQMPYGPNDRFPDRSDDHPMQSSFALWFYESIGGMRPLAPGFKQFELKPHHYRQLAWAKVGHVSPYGLIRSDWKNDQGVFTWDVAVPPGTSATAYVPADGARQVTESGQPVTNDRGIKWMRQENGRVVLALDSGTYHFQVQLVEQGVR